AAEAGHRYRDRRRRRIPGAELTVVVRTPAFRLSRLRHGTAVTATARDRHDPRGQTDHVDRDIRIIRTAVAELTELVESPALRPPRRSDDAVVVPAGRNGRRLRRQGRHANRSVPVDLRSVAELPIR